MTTVKQNKSTRQRLAEWSKTHEGRESYEKVAEEMRGEISEKPMNLEGLEEEIRSYADYCEFDFKSWDYDTLDAIARHFYELGCRSTAEKHDELKYNRQRAEEESVPNDLEEAAGEYAEEHGFRVPYDGSDNFYDDVDVKASKEGFIAGAKWQEEKEKEHSPWLVIPKLKEAALEFGEQAKDYEIGGQSFAEDMAIAFTRGAEWQKEQMMEEAVEGFIFQSEDYYPKELVARYDGELKHGDKVRIIIVKED